MISSDILNPIMKRIIEKQASYELEIQGHHGASEDFYWNDKRLLIGGPTTNCVCTVTEVLFSVLKEVGYEQILDFDDMKELLKICFVYDKTKHLWGIPQGIIEFQLGSEVNENDLEYGDFGQLWHVNDQLFQGVGPNRSHYLGHSILFLEKKDEYYRHFSSASATNGAKERDLLINRTFNSGHQRRWKFARLDISA